MLRISFVVLNLNARRYNRMKKYADLTIYIVLSHEMEYQIRSEWLRKRLKKKKKTDP